MAVKLHINPNKLFLTNKLVRKVLINNSSVFNSTIYSLNNVRHNPNGPAVQILRTDGTLRGEEYWVNGRLHNPNGPSITIFGRRGDNKQWYYINGVEYSESEHKYLRSLG